MGQMEETHEKKKKKTSKNVMLDEDLCCGKNLNGKNAREQECRGQTYLRGDAFSQPRRRGSQPGGCREASSAILDVPVK